MTMDKERICTNVGHDLNYPCTQCQARAANAYDSPEIAWRVRELISMYVEARAGNPSVNERVFKLALEELIELTSRVNNP